MGAARDGLDCLAYRAAILDDWPVFGEVAHRDLMAERNVVEQFHLADRFSFEGDGADRRAFFQIKNSDAYVVVRFVQKNAMLHIHAIDNAESGRGLYE